MWSQSENSSAVTDVIGRAQWNDKNPIGKVQNSQLSVLYRNADGMQPDVV